MRLIRFGEAGNEKPGIIDKNNKRRDASAHFRDWDRHFFQSGGLNLLQDMATNFDSLPEIQETERWAACISRPGKVIGVGLNYSDHALESGMPVPTQPIIFQK